MNAVNADGATPLHDAIHRDDVSVIKELLHSGALSNITAVTGWVRWQGHGQSKCHHGHYPI